MIQSTALIIVATVATIFAITVGYVYTRASRKAHLDYA